MPTPDIGSVPFQEAIDHFRGKLNIPTKHFDDMMGEVHAKAFTVAGATKLDLLTDIRASVDQAIASGTTITDFRKQFDAAVQKHGWSYKGKRGWRTRVIFDNNLRPANMAGRWQQFQRTKDTRPYLQYFDAGDRRVRPEHHAWNGTILLIDDPWWNTHYPPNGYGCRCGIRSLSLRQIRREKLEISQAPEIEESERINIKTGEVYGDVPKGIDTGWNYNVGKAWLGPEIAFGKKAVAVPEAIRRTVIGDTSVHAALFAKPFKTWADDVFKREHSLGEIRTVGYMNHEVVKFATAKGITMTDSTITISDKQLRRMQKEKQRRVGKQLIPADDLSLLPTHIGNPRAVLWDKKREVVVYVFNTGKHGEGKPAKLLVEISFRQKGEISNSIRSGGVVDTRNLKDKNHYEVIEGEI